MSTRIVALAVLFVAWSGAPCHANEEATPQDVREAIVRDLVKQGIKKEDAENIAHNATRDVLRPLGQPDSRDRRHSDR